MLKEVLKHIEQRNRFVLTSHARPDGDAIGSALACRQILRAMGKEADVILRDGVPRIYQPLPFAGEVVQSENVNGDYEAAIILECDSIQRTRLRGLESKFLINIDHHQSGRPFAQVNWIDPKAVATAEMVYRLAREAGVKISPEIATCLYTAVLTDTGSFMFEGTNEHTFELARELVLAGADPALCARNIYFGHSTAKMRLLGAALSNLHREGPLAWISVSQEQMQLCHAKEEDCEGLVNYALSMQGVEVALFFRELPDGRFRVSLRSKGHVNVAAVAERLRGGDTNAPAVAPLMDHCRPPPLAFSQNCGSVPPYNKSQIPIVISPANSTSNPAASNGGQRPLMDWLLLAGFCGFLFFFGLAYFGLLGADEPRYAQVAREMLARHDWITPTLGGAPWLEKPVLYYWQAMLAYSVFGVSDWAARLPSAVDATLMVVAVYLFLRRFRPGFQLDGALMVASASGVIGFARAASMDMPLSATFTIAMLSWYAWYESAGKRYLALSYIFLGLAMLAKGPVAPFFAAVIVAIFAAGKGDYRLILKTCWLPGIALFLVTALPWYVAVQLRNPQFFRVFILEHNLERFGKDLYHHTQPFWYYLPVVLLGLVPWTMFVSAALAETIRVWWKEKRELFQSEDALPAFLVIWLILPVTFFSFSASKLPGYILPALPAGTLLLAEYVRRHVIDDDRPSLLLIALHSVVAALPVVAALMMQYIVFHHGLPWGRATAISTGFAAVLAVGIVLTLRRPLGLRVFRFVTLVPVVLAVGAALKLGAPSLDATLSARPLAQEINRVDNRSLPLAILRLSRETEYGLNFYRDQKTLRYETAGVPAGEHLLITPEGWQKNIAKWTPGRRVTYVGSFAEQGMDYYWVAGKDSH